MTGTGREKWPENGQDKAGWKHRQICSSIRNWKKKMTLNRTRKDGNTDMYTIVSGTERRNGWKRTGQDGNTDTGIQLGLQELEG